MYLKNANYETQWKGLKLKQSQANSSKINPKNLSLREFNKIIINPFFVFVLRVSIILDSWFYCTTLGEKLGVGNAFLSFFSFIFEDL